MRQFENRRPPKPGEVSVSIKVRVSSGCFHREHSPRAYALIDQELAKLTASESSFIFEEHESGPELLVYLALTTAGITLVKSVIDLVTAIIKARSEGVAKGDGPASPIELIVRRSSEGDEFREEVVLRLGPTDSASKAMVEKCLKAALGKVLEPNTQKAEAGSSPPISRTGRKRSGPSRT
jgi:hypothetical protein